MDLLDDGQQQIDGEDWEIEQTQGVEDPEEKPSVQQSIEETMQTLDLFMNNKFQEALDLMQPWAHCSSYHALGKSTVSFIQSILSFDPEDFARTMEVLKSSVSVCNRLRKRGTLLYISRLLRGVDYNSYTIEEVHAELCYAECLLLTALTTFVSDNSFVNFIKGGLRIRACYRAYKEASQILEQRTWDDENEKRHFESGVRMGLGIFYLVVAHLPARVIRVLEMIGFCGDKVMGLEQMYKSVALEGSLRAPLTALFLVCYTTIITYIFGLGDGDLCSSEYIVKKMLQRYPRGALYLFLHGRLLVVKGQIDQAINVLQDSLTVQDKWKQMQNLGSWEIMWCYSFKFEWRSACKYLDFLRSESRWSPAIYNYAYALALYQRYNTKGDDRFRDPQLLQEIEDLMKKVPGLKQKLAGKSFPLEKFVVAKAKKFTTQNNRLILPFTEMIYVFSMFPVLRERPDIMQRILDDIEAQTPTKPLDDEDISAEQAEDYCLAKLLKAACLKTMGRASEAEADFREVLTLESHLADDVYVATYAMAELGYLALDRGHYVEALKWLHQACNSHTDYHLESFLHYRLHAAMRHIEEQSTKSSSITEELTEVALQEEEPSSNTSNEDHQKQTNGSRSISSCSASNDDLNGLQIFDDKRQAVATG